MKQKRSAVGPQRDAERPMLCIPFVNKDGRFEQIRVDARFSDIIVSMRQQYLQGPWDGSLPRELQAVLACKSGSFAEPDVESFIIADMRANVIPALGFDPHAAYEASKTAKWIGRPPNDPFAAAYSVAMNWLFDEEILFGQRAFHPVRAEARYEHVWPALLQSLQQEEKP